VVDGVRAGGHLPLGLRAEPRRAHVLLHALHAGEKKTPAKNGTSTKGAAFRSSFLTRSNGEGFLTLITSAFSRMPGAVSMAVIPSRRNAGPARQGKASGFGRRKSKNEEKEDPRSDCTYLPGKTRRRRAASRQGGGRRRAPRLRPHEPSSNPRPSTSRRRREIFFRLSLFRDLLACRVCFACLVGLKRESGARRAGAPPPVPRSRAGWTRGGHRTLRSRDEAEHCRALYVGPVCSDTKARCVLRLAASGLSLTSRQAGCC
jgi:hypothetical protein